MYNIRTFNPMVRAIAVISAVAVLAVSVTFAALTSNTATLTNNTINSATAILEVSSDAGCNPGGTFGTTDTGFAFNGLIPGGAASPDQTFCLRNIGTADLALKLFVPVAPTWTVLPSGDVDDGEVDVHVSCASGAFTLDARLQDLESSAQSFSGGALGDGNTVTCTINVDMNSGAFTGSSASSGNFDLEFSGDGV